MRTDKGLRRGAAALALLGAALAGGGQALAQTLLANNDGIIRSSLCVGFDCPNSIAFGFDTIRLMENNLRITFIDTSTTAGIPARDWQIVINDSTSGGQNFFGIHDCGNSFAGGTSICGPRVFGVAAGAPANSLFVASTGRVGLRTQNPVLDMHIATGNTPGLRLEQDNSSGFTAQTWDIAGNEANFFIRDVTGGSRLPFRIRPGAPTNSIDIAASGNVGFGTAGALASLHINRDDPRIRLSNTTNMNHWDIAAGESLVVTHVGSNTTMLNIAAAGNTAAGRNATAAGVAGSAFGQGSRADGNNSSAFGRDSRAIGTNATAVGHRAEAEGFSAAAFGLRSRATRTNAAAFGADSLAGGIASTAAGFDSQALGDDSTAIGRAARATGAGASAFGRGSQATVNNSSAFGRDSLAEGTSATAAGHLSRATGFAGAAFGLRAEAAGTNSIAIGIDSQATATNSAAFGRAAAATHSNAVAIGANSATDANNTLSVGAPGNLRRITNVANGVNATDAATVGQVWQWLSTGDYKTSSGPVTYGSLAVGFGAVASHPDGTALGEDAQATGERATAVGTRAEASGDEAVALGADSRASHANSAAIGTDARTTRPGQMALGTASNTYTLPGIASQASRAAQRGPIELVTTDRAGNLASDGGSVFRRIGENAEGVAIAMAAQAIHVPLGQRFAVGGSWGAFEGENALSVGGAFRFSDNFQVDAGVGFGLSNDTVGGRVGGVFSW